MLTGDPKTRHEIFVASFRPTILESYPNNLVARRLRTVPRALKRYECIPTIFCRELFAVVEHQIQNRRVRLKQYIRNNGCFYFLRRQLCKARLRMRADIRIGPAVKGALFHTREVIGRKIVAESIALLNPGVEFSGGRVECEGGRIAHSRGKSRLAGAVCLEPLN